MSKRSATELQPSSTSDFHPSKKTPRGTKQENEPQDEMGEFEDGWEDEYESDEDVVDGAANEGENGTLRNCYLLNQPQ